MQGIVPFLAFHDSAWQGKLAQFHGLVSCIKRPVYGRNSFGVLDMFAENGCNPRLVDFANCSAVRFSETFDVMHTTPEDSCVTRRHQLQLAKILLSHAACLPQGSHSPMSGRN